MMSLGHSVHLQAPGESIDLQRLRAIGKAMKMFPKSGLVVWMLLLTGPARLHTGEGVCEIGVQLNIC